MAKSTDIAISVDNISKQFHLPHERITSVKSAFTNLYKRRSHSDGGVHHALRDVSFTVRQGEFFGIVGRNGSGKSTLLKMIAGIYQPTEGSVAVHGKLVPFIELGVGFNPELTGRENVFLNGAMLGFSRRQVFDMYDDIVAFAEIEKFMDQKLKNYSSGMQVRLAFSMAIRAKADVLLVDEVLAVGDADFQRKCFEYFRTLKRQHKTVVFVSHDMNSVREYCDRAVLIDDTRLVASGSADEIAKKYTKLFTPSEDTSKQESKNDKWGNGTAVMSSVVLNKRMYTEEDEQVRIEVSVEAKEAFPDGLLVGFTIKDQTGQPICGTNNSILKKSIKSVREGERLEIGWVVPNIFNDGVYVVEPAVVSQANGEICQWWDNAKTFKVRNEFKTPYIVAPPIEVEISRG